MLYKQLSKITIIIAITLTLAIEPIYAQAPEGQEHTVQPGEWLSQIAEQFLGDTNRYTDIVEATNAKAAEDSTFALITDPNVIEIGQKLWIPVSDATVTTPVALTVQRENVVGIYNSLTIGASSPGLDSTLYLNSDDTARLVSDYLNDDAPIEELGSWAVVDDQVIVTLTGQVERAYDEPVVTTYDVDAGTLVETRDDAFPGAYVVRFLPFDALTTGLESIPYDAVAAQQEIIEAGYGGIYKAFLSAATCCGRDITLTLNPNGLAFISTNFLNDKPPILGTGTWVEVGEGRIDITWDEADSPLMLALVDGTLQTTAEEDAYGSDGLTLYYYPTIAVNSNLPTVTGTVTYRERIALLPQSLITVQLVDISLADAPAEVISEQIITAAGQQPPFAFELSYNPRTFDPTRTYAVQARIERDGQLLFINDTNYPVLTNGAPSSVEMVLVSSGQAATAATADSCAAVAVATSLDAPPDRSNYLAYGEDSPVNADIVGTVLSVDSQADDASIQWRDAVLSGLGYCSGDFAPDQVTIYNTDPGQATVVTASEVLFNDSVTAQEVRLDLVEQPDGWQVEWGGIRFQCARGDNTTDLQPMLCP